MLFWLNGNVVFSKLTSLSLFFLTAEFKAKAQADMRLPPEMVDEFLAQFKDATAFGAKLSHDRSFLSLKGWVDEKRDEIRSSANPSTKILIGFDFDMTLKIHVDGKLCVRGGEGSMEFLHWARQIGCEMIIVTGSFEMGGKGRERSVKDLMWKGEGDFWLRES